MSELILMLTRADETVADARAALPELCRPGLSHVGFKDVGLPPRELEALATDIRANGCAVHLEVVSESVEASLNSARMAVDLGVDYLLGGIDVGALGAVVGGSGIKFFPYVGEVVGHPCLLRGSIKGAVEDVRRAEAAGAAGINLLAYRYDGDVPALIEAVVAATELPVICAGSIDSPERVAVVAGLGAWGFTIGTAILDRAFLPGAPPAEQVQAALDAARG
jgi:4-hydroxythreonine-4-phosphate dehydrogenase